MALRSHLPSEARLSRPNCAQRLLTGCALAVLAASSLFCFIPGVGGVQPLNEAAAKIQFMHYVAQYAVWPKDALPPESRQFNLGVLGENPFGSALENYFKGKSVKGREFVVRLFNSVDDVRDCQMLFVSGSEKANFGSILGKIETSSILTISDTDGFLQKNGMIFIYITEKSEITGGLGWDINPQAMKQARLQIDPFFIEKAHKPKR